MLTFAGWVAYSIYCRDTYIFCANAPGVLFGLYMVLLTLPLADAKVSHEATLCAGCNVKSAVRHERHAHQGLCCVLC